MYAQISAGKAKEAKALSTEYRAITTHRQTGGAAFVYTLKPLIPSAHPPRKGKTKQTHTITKKSPNQLQIEKVPQ